MSEHASFQVNNYISNNIQIIVSLTGLIILDCDGFDLVLNADLYLHVSCYIVFCNGHVLFTMNSYLIIRDLILV